MNDNPHRETTRKAAARYGLTGIVFTFLGPSLFWLVYPLGPFLAAALAELLVHTIRFLTFRVVVFPARKGYSVSLVRYLFSILPITATSFISIAIFRNRLDRTSLTLATAFIAAVVGFLWSRYVYTKPAGRL